MCTITINMYTEKYVKYTDFVQNNTDHILMRLEALSLTSVVLSVTRWFEKVPLLRTTTEPHPQALFSGLHGGSKRFGCVEPP